MEILGLNGDWASGKRECVGVCDSFDCRGEESKQARKNKKARSRESVENYNINHDTGEAHIFILMIFFFGLPVLDEIFLLALCDTSPFIQTKTI